MANIVTPIWKDLKYVYPSTPAPAYVDYILRRDSAAGEVIYTGRAYKRPGATELSFSVNNIVANFLSNDLPFSIIPATQPSGSYVTLDAATDCALSVWISVKPAGGSWSSFAELGYYQNDWAYYDGVYYRIEPERPNSASTWGPRSVTFLKTNIDTISTTETSSDRVLDCRMPFIETLGDPWRKDFRNYVIWSGTAYYVGIIIQPDGVWAYYAQAPGRRTCYDYALYFLSAWGGWSFLYLDAVKPSQNYDRKTAKRVYDSADLRAFGTVNYVNEITQAWDAKSPYFDDEQASKFWHVAGTTKAYLFDMEAGTWTPVNVANTSWDGKTYRNQGAKRVRYDIKLTLAQDRLRR